MALDPLALFDLATLKSHCKVTTADPATAQDTEAITALERIGAGASEYCENRIGERIQVRNYTVVRDGDGRATLLRLPRPIRSVTSITIDDVALASTEYVFNAAAGTITLRSRRFTKGLQNVEVVLSAGYDFADASQAAQVADIVAAALDLAKSHWDEWNAGAIALSSITLGPATAIIKPGLNPRIEKFLDGKRDVRA